MKHHSSKYSGFIYLKPSYPSPQPAFYTHPDAATPDFVFEKLARLANIIVDLQPFNASL